MMNLVLGIGFWVWGGIGVQGPMDKPLSLVLRAAPVPRIVELLSAASGIPMAATGVFAKDVLLIDVHERSVSEVMGKIAEVTGGAWKNDKGTYRLTRSATAERAQENREQKYRTLQIQTEIDRSKEIRDGTLTAEQAKALSADFRKKREKNAQYAFVPFGELNNPVNMAPSNRALLRLISSLDLSEVAMLIPGDRIAYSNKPTKMERPLTISSDEILSKFMQEQNVWSDAVAGMADSAPSRFGGDPLDARGSITQVPDRILLVANRTNSSALVQFRLFLISGEQTVGSSSLWIGSDAIRKYSSRMVEPSAPSGTKIRLSADSLTMLEATKGWQRPNQGPAPGPLAAGIALLTHPEKTDPLALAVTDGFVSVAEARHSNLIASLPDELVALNFMPNTSSETLDSFLQSAENIGEVGTSEKDGWLVVKPRREYSIRLLRVYRDALGKYLRSIVSEGRASLDAQAEFALNSQPSDYDTYGMPMGMLLDLNSTQNVDQDWTTLKLWGALSLEQRNDLIKGQKIPFKSLTPLQIGLIGHEAYDRTYKSFISMTATSSAVDIHRLMEPTECLPDGLNPDGFLSLTTEASTAILASSTRKNVRMNYARVFDEQQLGNSLASYERSQADANPMFDRFQLIQRVNYTFKFHYAEGIADQTSLHDIVVPADSQPLTMDELPKEMRDKILAAKEAAKNNPAFATPKRVPPPWR